jgi:hypothetical protein
LALDRLTLLADHRQLTLRIDIALKIQSSPGRKNLEGGKTAADGQTSTADKIDASGSHVPGN